MTGPPPLGRHSGRFWASTRSLTNKRSRIATVSQLRKRVLYRSFSWRPPSVGVGLEEPQNKWTGKWFRRPPFN